MDRTNVVPFRSGTARRTRPPLKGPRLVWPTRTDVIAAISPLARAGRMTLTGARAVLRILSLPYHAVMLVYVGILRVIEFFRVMVFVTVFLMLGWLLIQMVRDYLAST
ncbi:hypothetical protein JOD69_004425 [Methylocaldum sp. RMAD-M]|nr:hypothetical protein [Methylocaldum sp. RMAD-M]